MAVALASERSRAAAFISILFKVEISGGTGGGNQYDNLFCAMQKGAGLSEKI